MLVNVPPHDNCEIVSIVEGETIRIVSRSRHDKYDRSQAWDITMETFLIGDHMLQQPQELREMIGRFICSLIRQARDIGRHQAKEEIRRILGVKER